MEKFKNPPGIQNGGLLIDIYMDTILIEQAIVCNTNLDICSV